MDTIDDVPLAYPPLPYKASTLGLTPPDVRVEGRDLTAMPDLAVRAWLTDARRAGFAAEALTMTPCAADAARWKAALVAAWVWADDRVYELQMNPAAGQARAVPVPTEAIARFLDERPLPPRRRGHVFIGVEGLTAYRGGTEVARVPAGQHASLVREIARWMVTTSNDTDVWNALGDRKRTDEVRCIVRRWERELFDPVPTSTESGSELRETVSPGRDDGLEL
jgi:hypothetical protein